ncbi:MAG: chlorophyllide reductase subunit Z [Chloroflexaceae bacterium]|nr:chlorophyllide reductase subunit Z [Chloroflexaceae bacterium]
MQLIRDISDSSAFWGAAWVFGCFADMHIICDAPIGCYNLLGVAVTDYTDALPYMANLTPTSIREEDVINGTSQALKRTIDDLQQQGYLDHKQLVVVSSAESEMISADHQAYLSTIMPEARFFWSHALEQDEWQGRNSALRFAWEHYGTPALTTPPQPRASQLVNIIGPSLGCFNAPADLYEMKRLVRGIGGEINLIYPYEACVRDTPRLAEAAVNIVMYREFGEPLAQILGQPYLFAPFGVLDTTSFLRDLGQLLGRPTEQVEAFIAAEKHTTLQLVWDMWRGPQSDWFATVDCAIVAARSYVDGLRRFLGDELGMRIVWSSGRPRHDDEPDNSEIRRRLHRHVPTFVFGSINEKMYLAEANARSGFFLPATFPGPVVRRTFGTPFMGYAGAAYLMQEMVNRFYETVFQYLPVETVSSDTDTAKHAHPAHHTPATPTSTMPWTQEAAERLNTALEDVPYLSRISASRTLRSTAEEAAREQGASEVTLPILEAMLHRRA